MTRTILVARLALPIGALIALGVRALAKGTNPDAANVMIFNGVRAAFAALLAAAMISLGATGQASWPIAIGLAALPGLLAFWFVRRAIVGARHLRDR